MVVSSCRERFAVSGMLLAAMSLIIFPIIIGLCVLGLVFLIFKKIPQIAKYPIGSLLVPAPPLDNAMASTTILKKAAGFGIVFSAIKKYYMKTRQIFSRVAKKFLEAIKKIKPIILVKRKITGFKQGMVIRKKGDFSQLREFFDKKKTALILPPMVIEADKDLDIAIPKKEDEPKASLRTSTEIESPIEPTIQDRLDFKKFLNNGGQEKKSYKLKKFSFDQLFKKNNPKAGSPKTATIENKSVETLEDKPNSRIAKFVQKEQALIQKIADGPRNAELYAKLGELYLKVKNWQDAKASFNYLLELEPQNKKARNALDKINKVLHNK